MSEQIEFIPLRSIKYKEKSLILTGLTPQGRKDLFLTSYLKNNKHKYPFLTYPLPILEIIYFRKPHFSLPFVRDIHLLNYSVDILQIPTTQQLLTFLSEVYYVFLHHIDINTYLFIRSEISEIHRKPIPAPDWIFYHLIKLLKMAGFGLQNWIDWEKIFFSSDPYANTPLGKIPVHLLKLLYHFTQPLQTPISIAVNDYLHLLEIIIDIFQSHIPTSREIQSLDQMKLFFSALEKDAST